MDVRVLQKIEINGVAMMKGSDRNLYEPDPDTAEIQNLPNAAVALEVGRRG